MMKIRRKDSGFTLIELVIVLTLLGILVATAVPKFVNLRSDALTSSKQGHVGIVRSAFAIYTAENKTEPTVAQLVGNLQGDATEATDSSGIEFTLPEGCNFKVLTFSTSNCSTATVNTTPGTTDIVRCVKGTSDISGC